MYSFRIHSWRKIASVFFEKTGAIVVRWILRLTHTLSTFMKTLNNRCTYPETSGCRHLFSGVITNAGHAWPPHPLAALTKELTQMLVCFVIGLLHSIMFLFPLFVYWLHFEFPVGICSNLLLLHHRHLPRPQSLKLNSLFRLYKSAETFKITHCELKLPYFTPFYLM
jgi:hypothetical protein